MNPRRRRHQRIRRKERKFHHLVETSNNPVFRMMAGLRRSLHAFASTMKQIGTVVQAAGESLTLLGEQCFGTKRLDGECDGDYRARVTARTERFRHREVQP